MKYSYKRNIIYSIPLISIVVILIVLCNSDLSNVQWPTVQIQIIINLFLVIVFTIILSNLSGKVSELNSLYQEINIKALSPKTDNDQLIEIVKLYYSDGGEKEITLRNRHFSKFEMHDISDFNVKLIDCTFDSKINTPDNQFVFISSIRRSSFTADLLSNTFNYYSFENCRFQKHNYGQHYKNCSFTNVDFTGTEIVENTFILDMGSENMMFYNSEVSSTRFYSKNDHSKLNFDIENDDALQYLLNLEKNVIQDTAWEAILKFNSKTRLSTITMSFDIYLSLYKKNRELMKNIEIRPLMGNVLINPTLKRPDITIYTMP